MPQATPLWPAIRLGAQSVANRNRAVCYVRLYDRGHALEHEKVFDSQSSKRSTIYFSYVYSITAPSLAATTFSKLLYTNIVLTTKPLVKCLLRELLFWLLASLDCSIPANLNLTLAHFSRITPSTASSPNTGDAEITNAKRSDNGHQNHNCCIRSGKQWSYSSDLTWTTCNLYYASGDVVSSTFSTLLKAID